MLIMIKSRRMRRTGNIALMGERQECIQGFVGKVRRKEITRKKDVGWKILL
jgi:hypothetical protein